jgi:hypothetical protein
MEIISRIEQSQKLRRKNRRNRIIVANQKYPFFTQDIVPFHVNMTIYNG